MFTCLQQLDVTHVLTACCVYSFLPPPVRVRGFENLNVWNLWVCLCLWGDCTPVVNLPGGGETLITIRNGEL